MRRHTVRRPIPWSIIFILSILGLQSSLHAHSGSRTHEEPGPAAIRALILAGAEAIEMAPVPRATDYIDRHGPTSLKELERFTTRRTSLVTRLEAVATAPTLPTYAHLARTRMRISHLHDKAIEGNLHDPTQSDSLRFSTAFAVAEGYLDCALAIIRVEFD